MTITEAVVLAGGEGRNLRPLTTYQPKPMLPVANRPILEYVLNALVEAGVEHSVVVVGHGSERIQTRFGNTYRGMGLSYVHQEVQLGSGHALQQAAGHVDGAFLVVNGDSIVDADIIGRTVDRYESTDSVATIAVAYSDTPEEYGVVLTDHGLIADIDEHPSETKGYLVNAGVYVFTDAVFAALNETRTRANHLHLTDVIGHLGGPVTSVIVNGGWLDPTTPWRLLAVTETVLRRQGDVVVADSANLHESVVIDGPAVIGPSCELGPGVVVCGGSCLQANIHVGAGTVIDRSILFTDARVGGSVHLCDSIVGTGVDIGSGTISPGGVADVNLAGRLFAGRHVGSVVADRATVGANATLLPGSLIGAYAHIGAGVVVDGTVTQGVEVTC